MATRLFDRSWCRRRPRRRRGPPSRTTRA
jgi:hypothetical protein